MHVYVHYARVQYSGEASGPSISSYHAFIISIISLHFNMCIHYNVHIMTRLHLSILQLVDGPKLEIYSCKLA